MAWPKGKPRAKKAAPAPLDHPFEVAKLAIPEAHKGKTVRAFAIILDPPSNLGMLAARHYEFEVKLDDAIAMGVPDIPAIAIAKLEAIIEQEASLK